MTSRSRNERRLSSPFGDILAEPVGANGDRGREQQFLGDDSVPPRALEQAPPGMSHLLAERVILAQGPRRLEAHFDGRTASLERAAVVVVGGADRDANAQAEGRIAGRA